MVLSNKASGRRPRKRARNPLVLELLEDRLAPAGVMVTSPGNQTANEGALASFNLGSFSDSNMGASSWTVDVNWGDGTAETLPPVTSQGSLGSRPHTYGEEGNFTVTVTVTDNVNMSG